MRVESGRQEINFGILAPLTRKKNVSDIAVLCDGSVWVDVGNGMELASGDAGVVPAFRLAQDVRIYAVQLCSQLGKRLDDSLPIADASSVDGVRVHAVLAPIVPQGAAISIRFPSAEALSLEGLEVTGFIPTQMSQIFRILVKKKATWVITGGTGTGKTTLLKALLNECDANERIVSVEETRELAGCAHQNMVSLVTRGANVEGAGRIGLSDLVKATVRMRPDRIVLGECRGEEVADLLRAFNSGHRGGFVTIHADSIERLPKRLIALGQLAGLSEETVHTLVEGAFDVVVHCARVDGRRFVSKVGIVGKTLLSIPPPGVYSGARGEPQSELQKLDGWENFAREWGLTHGGLSCADC